MSLSAGGRGAVSVRRTWAEESEVRTHFVAVLVRGELFAVRSFWAAGGLTEYTHNPLAVLSLGPAKLWTFLRVRHEVRDNIHTAETGVAAPRRA